MGTARINNTLKLYTEAESREIYDLMISNSRIIQVTAGGVRVFYKTTQFSVKEILRARRVFPRIDRSEKLDFVLDRIYDQPKSDEARKEEIVQTIYRPIKKEIDEILVDNRNFLADHGAMVKIRTDLNNVIKNLDGVTLNMLNKVLKEDQSEFKRNIEFAVYSGLIASVIFGDFKTHSSDKKIVEDVILIAITYGTREGETRDRMLANFGKKDAPQHYDLDHILSQVGSVEKSKSNIISEILFVAQKYTDSLDESQNEPIRALITLQNEVYENTAIATGALFTKNILREYRNQYRNLEEKLREALAIGEDKLRVQLMRRMNKDSKVIQKLSEFFLEDITIKQMFREGFDRVIQFREFHSALADIRQNCQNYIQRLRELVGEPYRILENIATETVEVIDIAGNEYSSIVTTSDSSVLDEEIWSCISAGNKSGDVDFILRYAAANLQKFGEKCAQIYRVNQKLELSRNFFAINESLRKLKPYAPRENENLYNIGKVVEIASRKAKDRPEIRIIKAIPSDTISVMMDPFKVEQMISTLIENATDAIENIIEAHKEQDPQNSRVHHINIIVKRDDDLCKIKIQDSGGGMDEQTYNTIFVKRETLSPSKKGASLLSMLEYIDTIEGASVNVDTKKGTGTTFEIILPVADEPPENNISTKEIISALEERHWTV